MTALRGIAAAIVLAAGGALAQVQTPEEPPPRPQKPPPRKAPPPPPQQQQPAAAPALQCPPPPPGPQPPPPPGATISGSSICGATIIGGTISGATIIGGTISNGSISGGTIAGPGSGAPAQPQNQPVAPAPQPPPQQQPQQPKPSAPPAATQPAAQPNQQQRPSARGDASREKSDKKQKQAGSGGDSDDEDEADLAARALERALVQRGALLLPVWGFEISPAFSYGHISQDTVATVTPQDAPPTTVALRRRIHQMTGSLTARLGLPFDLQIEASAPATFVLSNVVVAGAASDASGFGLGDPRVSLTWQMIHAGDTAPDIFLAGSWKSSFGTSPFDARSGQVGLGTGYQSVGGTVTAVKSADPLVLLANAGYTTNLPVSTADGRRDPGDTFSLGGGAILAVSPDTSLSFLLDTHYKRTDAIDGKPIPGSDETFAVLQLGLGRVLSRRVLLNVTAAVGLTPDAPNFQLGLSMPIRF